MRSWVTTKNRSKSSSQTQVHKDDHNRWFARALLKGEVLAGLKDVGGLLAARPEAVTERKPQKRVALMVAALAGADVHNKETLRNKLKEDKTFLLREIKAWCRSKNDLDRKNFVNCWKGEVIELLR